MANQDSAFGLRPSGKVGQNRENQGLSEYNNTSSANAIYSNNPISKANTDKIPVYTQTDE